MTIFNFISLFGGLALFLYGMQLMGDGLKKGSSGALKAAMEKVTNNPLVGFLLGLAVTAVIQSSTATIVLTSGLVGAGVLTLHQSIGIILGANVGTTITGQIIRLLDLNADGGAWLNLFKPSTLAPLAAIAGILFIMAIKTPHSDTVGSITMGFGILFTGLLNMTAAVSPLGGVARVCADVLRPCRRAGARLSRRYVRCLPHSKLVGDHRHPAGAFHDGRADLRSVYAIIIGVNIGDCVTTAIVCSIGSKADAKRTGVVHIIFNLCASVIIITALTVLHHAGARRPVGADDDLRRHRERPHDLPPFHRGSAPAGVRAV